MKCVACLWMIGMLVFVMGAAAQEDVPDYGQYRLLDVQELDLHAAPGRTAAHLSPDGTRFAHLQGNDLCLYALRGMAWQQDRCHDLGEVLSGPPDEMHWSPDGRYLTLPVTMEALVFFRDSDTQVFDTETGTVLNLTEDGVEGGLLAGSPAGNVDMAPRWLDSDTLLFIRMASNAEVGEGDDAGDQWLSPAVYQVDVPEDGVTEAAVEVRSLPADQPFASYVLAVDGERERAAVNVDPEDLSEGSDIWQGSLADEEMDLLFNTATGTPPPRYLGYSADGSMLMMLGPDNEDSAMDVWLVPTEAGAAVSMDPQAWATDGEPFVEPRLMGAGWSPVGTALAYVVRDSGNPGASGLYITPGPGEPGQLILPGEFYGTTCCYRMPIQWGANDVIIIGRGAESGVLLVQVGM